MSTLTPFFERYRRLSSAAGDNPVLVIDTHATPQALLDAAQQRIRARRTSRIFHISSTRYIY